MREYYARLFREIRREVFVFWKAQIGVGLLSGTITAIANAIRQQSALSVAIWSIGIAIAGYLALLLLFGIWATVRAPAKLDGQKQTDIEALDRRSKTAIRERENELASAKERESELKQLLSAKHPHDEHKLKIVGDVLATLTEKEREFVAWLLTMDSAGGNEVQKAGFRLVVQEVEAKQAATHLVMHDIIRAGNGTEVERRFKINQQFAPTLRDILYPSRPVTPPPS
jgi:hypothetical protein